jgi:Peptidase M15
MTASYLLSQNFSLSSLTFSETGVRRGIDNTPNAEQIVNLTELAMALERVQLLLGFPITVHSAFRSAKLNAAIGGSPRSAHMDGYACDFTCGQFGSPLEVCKAIAGSDIPFDQCIYEGAGNSGGWCHFSIAPALRKETLTAHFDGGKVSYSTGIV